MYNYTGMSTRRAMEKRTHRRVKRELLCQVQDLDSENPRMPHDVYVSDISEGGIRFRNPKFLPLNHRLAFTIEIPKHRNLEVTAKAVWVSEYRSLDQYSIGAYFSNLNGLDKAVLQNYLSV